MKRKRTGIFFVAAILLVMMVAVSCSEQVPSQKLTDPDQNGNGTEIAPEGTAEVSLVIDETKSLASDLNRDIAYWEFMATPKFSLANGEKLWGQVSYWRVLPEMDTSTTGVKTTANLGKYTSGDWYFEVRALNDQKHVIYVGSKQQVIKDGLPNIVHITMLTDRADDTHGNSIDTTSTYTGATGAKETGTETIQRYGQLHVGIELNNLDLDPQNVSISVYRQAVNKNSVSSTPELVDGVTWTRRGAGEPFTKWFKEANPDNYRNISGNSSETVGIGRAYYECLIPNLDAGPYVYTFYVNAMNTSGTMIPIAGQAVNVMIMGNEETQIKGTLLANEYVQTRLVLTEVGKIYGSINGRNYISIDVGNNAELSFEQNPTQIADSKESPVEYFWIVDGNYLENEHNSTLSLPCPLNENGKTAYGIHRVSLVTFGELGSMGNSTIDVIFNPSSGPGDWDDFEWPEDYLRPSQN